MKTFMWSLIHPHNLITNMYNFKKEREWLFALRLSFQVLLQTLKMSPGDDTSMYVVVLTRDYEVQSKALWNWFLMFYCINIISLIHCFQNVDSALLKRPALFGKNFSYIWLTITIFYTTLVQCYIVKNNSVYSVF